ncbi:MAG: transglutaminase domain-containing protein [Lachnospiraceae bacterium]|nr:transglutaminase domain-containing protein [Lachnospiraceae bacterium]
MVKRMSRQEKKRLIELENTGITIDEVYGTRRTSSLFLCLSKALIIFLVCGGTLTGFCDAFSLNYNKGIVLLSVAIASTLISLLYVKRSLFYVGYIVLLILFTIELLRYYLYANSGFQAIMNRVREAYGDHFNMSMVRTSEETYTNRNVTITIALIFIVIFLVIMYNITISRYMNFAETFAISFIILEIPFYIGYKPPLLSVVMAMTGCIATGLLQRGSFNRVTIPGKNAPDFIKDRFFKKEYYTTRGSHKGILTAIGFSFVFSLFLCIFSLPTYNRGLGETSENSAKSAFDDSIKIFVQNGFYGFFNRYDSLNGLSRGALGGVSSVRPDFETDLIVNYVPNSLETVYLRGFKGVEYAGQTWHGYISLGQYLDYSSTDGYDTGTGRKDSTILTSEVIDNLDDTYYREILSEDNALAKMQINYVDMSFGMKVEPYITLPENVSEGGEPLIPKNDGNKKEPIIHYTADFEYVPINIAEYAEEEEDFSENEKASDNSERTRITYNDYVNKLCTGVPYELDRYLEEFLKEQKYLSLDMRSYKTAVNSGDAEKVNDFRLKACAAIESMFLEKYPYSLSPGKTPTDADFVQYFLETQKRGYCSHFASAAVMILRHMGIPARYVEGYCIPSSLLTEEGVKLDVGGDEWYSKDNAYNQEKKVVSVEVSDYYAHAWVEVYLEGKGFVPYEVTPPSFEATPEASMGGIGRFFSRLLNVDLGIGGTSEGSLSITGDITQAVTEPSDFDLNIVLVPLGIVIAAVILVWIIYLLIKKILQEMKYSGYLKKEQFAPLVYGRYCDFVRKLKRKRIVRRENPLPMELAEILAEHSFEKNKGTASSKDTDQEFGKSQENFEKLVEDYKKIFTYAEKVLYSDYRSNLEEYSKYYGFIKNYK